MRKLARTMISLLMGAALVAPMAAQAQEQERGRDRGSWQRGGGERGERGDGERGGMARREAIQQGREAQRAVERPAPVARADAPAGARQWNRGNDNSGRDGARDWQQRRAAAAEANRNGGERRDWNREGHRNWNGDSARNWNRDGNRDDRRANRDSDRNDRRWNRDATRDRVIVENRDGNRRWTTDRRDWNGRDWDRRDDRWNRDWRNDRRYSWQDYRRHNRNVYRLPRYENRYGYSYRRWSPGYRFDPFFYGSSYWINDPWYYRLPPAYGDYRWVRYFDDAALVDIRTGEIVDIIYSFFF